MTDKPDRQDDGLPSIADALGWLLDAIKSEGVTPTPLLKRRFADAEGALLRSTPPSRDAAEGAPGKCGCGPMCMDLGEEGNCRYLRPERYVLRALVDAVWNHATESQIVPSTDVADKLIDAIFEESVQPKPAPDAMREALEALPEEISDNALWALASTLHSNVPEEKRPMSWSDFSPEQIERLHLAANAFLAALSAPVPPSDALRQNADHAHDKLYGFESVPPADGARRHLTDDEDRLVRSALAGSGTMIEELPSPAVAAEPETDEQLADQIHRIAGCHAKSERTARLIAWYRSKSAASLVRRDREPLTALLPFIRAGDTNKGEPSFYFADGADAVLSLRVQPGAGEREAIILECADIAAELEDCSADYIADKLREFALSRQAPHSSSNKFCTVSGETHCASVRVFERCLPCPYRLGPGSQPPHSSTAGEG